MSDAKLVGVRVLPGRSLSLDDGDNGSTSYLAGDELELSVDEAEQLEQDGFVESAK